MILKIIKSFFWFFMISVVIISTIAIVLAWVLPGNIPNIVVRALSILEKTSGLLTTVSIMSTCWTVYLQFKNENEKNIENYQKAEEVKMKSIKLEINNNIIASEENLKILKHELKLNDYSGVITPLFVLTNLSYKQLYFDVYIPNSIKTKDHLLDDFLKSVFLTEEINKWIEARSSHYHYGKNHYNWGHDLKEYDKKLVEIMEKQYLPIATSFSKATAN